MFGYIKPCHSQLRVCEYEAYKAVYCGFCKRLGRRYGSLSRLTLNYDFTFLALLYMSVSGSEVTISASRCMLNPFKKRPCCSGNSELDYCADVAMITLFYKVLDNADDGGFGEKLIARVCMPFVRHAFKRACAEVDDLAQVIYDVISRQSQIEDERCGSVDKACEPTALALSAICGFLTDEPGQKRVLERFGYLLGRFIYMSDALDDLEQDAKQKSYNPFLLSCPTQPPDAGTIAQMRQDAKGSLYLTIGEIEKTYALLQLSHFRPILDNIIHLGLHDTVERILQPKEKKIHDRPV